MDPGGLGGLAGGGVEDMAELPPLGSIPGEQNQTDGDQFVSDPQTDRAPASHGVRGRGKKSAHIVSTLEQYYTLLGLAVAARNQYDGIVIATKAHDLAVTLEEVARTDPRFYRVLVVLTSPSGWLNFALSYGGVGIALAANHGGAPRGLVRVFGLPEPPDRPERAPREEAPAEEAPVTNFMGEPVYGGPPPITVPSDGLAPQPPLVPTNPYTNMPEGLHVNEQMVERIRAEALEKALRLQAEAQRNAG